MPWYSNVETSRVKESKGRDLQIHVESSRAMVELCRVE